MYDFKKSRTTMRAIFIVVGLLVILLPLFAGKADAQEASYEVECSMLNFTDPSVKSPSGDFYSDTAIKLEMMLEHNVEPELFSSFFNVSPSDNFVKGGYINAESATSVSWVPHQAGEFTVSGLFFRGEDRVEATNPESCSATLKVIDREVEQPSDEPSPEEPQDHESGVVECTLELVEGNLDDGQAYVGDTLTAELTIFSGLPHQWEYVIDVNDGSVLFNNEGLGNQMTFTWEVTADHLGENDVYPLFYTEDTQPINVIHHYEACTVEFTAVEAKLVPPIEVENPSPTPVDPKPENPATDVDDEEAEVLPATGLSDAQALLLIGIGFIAVGVAALRCKPRKQWPRRFE